jgi:hypothetical protein
MEYRIIEARINTFTGEIQTKYVGMEFSALADAEGFFYSYEPEKTRRDETVTLTIKDEDDNEYDTRSMTFGYKTWSAAQIRHYATTHPFFRNHQALFDKATDDDLLSLFRHGFPSDCNDGLERLTNKVAIRKN